MSQEEHLWLKWNDHISNIHNVLGNLLQETAFCDITIVVEGHCIPAHKLVLIACSEYFRSLLAPLKEGQHPMIILEGIKLKEVKSILDYMYFGQVSIR